MIAALAAAALSLLLALAPDGQLRSMMFWLVGDLGGATERSDAGLALALLAVLAAIAATQARALDLLVRGDVQAATQGVDVTRVRRRLVLVAALATGTAVTLAGAVGFVGFAAPHVMRLLLGNEQRVLLPGLGARGRHAGADGRHGGAHRGGAAAAAGGRAHRAARRAAVPLAAGAPMSSVLRLQAVELAVAQRVLVRGLDVAIGAGERWVILGPNGAGKSTLLATLAGVRRPQAGTCCSTARRSTRCRCSSSPSAVRS